MRPGATIDELACFTSSGPSRALGLWIAKIRKTRCSQCLRELRKGKRRDTGRELTFTKSTRRGRVHDAEEAGGDRRACRSKTQPEPAEHRLPRVVYQTSISRNKCVVMTLYDKRREAAARDTLERLFPTARSWSRPDSRMCSLGGVWQYYCITASPQCTNDRRMELAARTSDSNLLFLRG